MSTPTSTSGNTNTASFEVRWDDVDLNGHLRGSRYLDYAVTARMKTLDQIGWGIPELMRAGITAVLLSEQIEYTREIYLAQHVAVSCQVVAETQDGTRWKCRHVIEHEDGKVAATIYSIGAWFDLASRRIVSPPDGLAEALQSIRSPGWARLVATTQRPKRNEP